jgi:hypothetical protein
MPRCTVCGDPTNLHFACNYCGGEYCQEHRLPEGHACDGVEFLTGGEAWFRDRESGVVVDSDAAFDSPDPIEPDHTVGTTPDPDFESAPEVRTRSGSESDESEGFVRRFIRGLLGR